jgi:sarcosine oxidase subunit beta
MLSDVAIVGAGILGVSTAFHLSALGERRVLVLDRRCLSAGATGRSGALVHSNYDNRDDACLAIASLEMFRNWSDRVGGSCDFQPVGVLQLGNGESRPSLPELVARQRQWGVDISIIDIAAAKELAPRLHCKNLAGPIAYEAGAGHCDPNLANRAMYDAAGRRGVEFIFDESVMAIVTKGGRAVGINTTKRTLATGAVVLAAGAWTNQLLGPLGLDLGFVTHLSRIAVFRPHEFDDDEVFPAVLDGVQDAWFRSLCGGRVLVGAEQGGRSGIDPGRIPDAATQRVIEAYRRVLAHRFAISPHAAPRGSWAGAYMLSPDRRPAVGQIPGIAKLFIACGDSGTSFKIAPAIGLGLAELIVFGEPRSVDVSTLCPARLEAAERQRSRRVAGRPLSERTFR